MPHIDSYQDRLRRLNDRVERRGTFVLYWMQQSQRADANHALEYAVSYANHLKMPLWVVLGLTGRYPEANLRHYQFMLEGLKETQTSLALRGIPMAVRYGSPPEVALDAGKSAAAIICDRGYLRHQREWRRRVAQSAGCPVIEVESDAVVPVDKASNKAEYAARTLRPKMHRLFPEFLRPVPSEKLEIDSSGIKAQGMDLSDTDRVLDKLHIDRSVKPATLFFRGGTSEARKRFASFLQHRLSRYEKSSNQPQTDDVSHMGPYLHFGQIGPLELALAVRKTRKSSAIDAYLEELVVRRELAINFVRFTGGYDTFACLPSWARKTLFEHGRDKRAPLYCAEDLEAAKTHDPYWNAAMKEMKHTGFMHNYMRMYWGKKILEWSPSPETGFCLTLTLNNKYFIDGRDPNSYAGVAWIYGLHDRAWAERPIFGKIRYMSASGLERKCDIRGYVNKVEDRIRERR